MNRTVLVGSLSIAAIGVLHRAALLFWHGSDLEALVAANPDWLAWQYLAVPALRDHFAASLLYLQQTPPLPNLVLGALLQVFEWPLKVAYACIALQNAITIASAVLIFQILCRLSRPKALYGAIAAVFLLSADAVILEYDSFGQMLYENLTMLELLLLVYALIPSAHAPRGRAFALAGLLTASVALTRASFSYFAVVPLVFLVAARVSRRNIALFLAPVALLHGGWMAKNLAVYGTVSVSTSSWKGVNFAHGLDWSGLGLPFQESILSDRDAYPDYFVEMVESRGIVQWHRGFQEFMPADVKRRQAEIDARLGNTNRASNSIGQRIISDLYMSAYWRFLADNPGTIASNFLTAYRIFWQPIRNYGAQYLSPFFVEPVVDNSFRIDRIAAGLLDGSIPEPQRLMIGTFRHVRGQLPIPEKQSRPTRLYTLPYLPTLILIANLLAIHIGLPLVAVTAVWRRSADVAPAYWLLAAAYVYAALVCNWPEFGENMRFRLSVEPLIWILSVLTLADLSSRLRRARRR